MHAWKLLKEGKWEAVNFRDYIDTNGIKKDAFEEMRNSHLPLYIYGAGNLAVNIKNKLEEHGINLEGCITDSGQEKFFGYKVYKYDEFTAEMESGSCNLLIGFASAYERKAALEKEEVFYKIYEIANPFDHHAHFDRKFVEECSQQLEEAYELFEDEYSRECFCGFINARIWENADYVRHVFRGEMDEFNNDITKTGPEEVFLDVGAYQGGSIQRFLRSNMGRYEKIIGIEPEKDNFNRLQVFCKENGINAELHCVGCWNKTDRLAFQGNADKCCRLAADGSEYINVEPIDNIVGEECAVSFINIGISTAEKEILEGAKRTICYNLPKIMVFMGSAREELYLLPRLIKQLNHSYKLYLRFIQAMPSRVFMYAVPDRERQDLT